MSLTNDMLKNLEKHHATLSEDNIAHYHATATSSILKKIFFFSVISVFIGLLVLDFVNYAHERKLLAAHTFPTIKYTIPKLPLEKKAKQKTKQRSVKPTAIQQAEQKPIAPKKIKVAAITPTLKVASQQMSQHVITTADFDNPQKTTTVKTLVPETAIEIENDHYQKALTLAEQGSFSKARDMLHSILRRDPENVEARIALGTLLLANNETIEASSVLQDGLIYHPDDPKIAMLYARALINEAKYNAALKVLSPFSNNLSNDPQYLAITADVDQAIGKITDAIGIYESLLANDPDNSQYLIDLGIALEKENRPNEALIAYKKALSEPDLPVGLKEIASERVAALGVS